ncbi:MAG: hypothetical protein FWD67_00580 [Betaproteobacteria bacterium]|nr:hypothetical protein [Betaproteobacteria bacterium]
MSDEEILEQRRLARLEKSKRDSELMQLHVLAADAMAGSGSQQLRERALSRVDAWEEKALCSLRYITEWRRMLSLPPPALRQAMLRHDADGAALRQNTPFGFLMGRQQ